MTPWAATTDLPGEIHLASGLAFLLLSLVVHLLSRGRNAGRLAPDCWLLVLFGLARGAKQLMEWWLITEAAAPLAIAPLADVLSTLSFFPLLEFGRRLVMGAQGPGEGFETLRRWLTPRVHLAAGAGVLGVAAMASDLRSGLETGTLYLLTLPGGALTAVGLLSLSGDDPDDRTSSALSAALALVGFATLQGLMVPGAPRTSGLTHLPDTFGPHLGSAAALWLALLFAAGAFGCMEIARRLLLTRLRGSDYRQPQIDSALAHRVADLESRLRALVAAEPGGVMLLDHRHRLLEINPPGLSLIEAEVAEQVIGSSLDPLISPAQRSAFDELCRHVCSGGTGTCELQIHGMKGTRRWLEMRMTPLRNGDGDIFALLAIARDVSQQQQAEDALRKSEQNLRHAQRVANIGSWYLDLRRNELIWSEQTCRIFGVSDGSPVSYQDFLAAVHPEDREAVDRAWRAALAGAPYDIEHRIIIDGQIKWVRERAELEIDADGNLIAGVGTVHDVSDHRRAEQAIREAEARCRTLVEQIPAVTYIASLDEYSSTTYVSPQLRSILGYTPEEWLADAGSWANRLHPEDRERVLAAVAASHTSGSRFRCEYRMLRTDGSVIWFRDDGQLVRSDEGEPLFLQGVMVDITEIKRAEDALRDSESKYRLLFEANPHPMWVYDLDHLTFLTVNNAAVTRYGWSRQEFLAMTIADLRPLDDAPAAKANVALIADGLNRAGIWRHRLKDGSSIDVEITSHPIQFDHRRCKLVLALDVTDRLRAERQVRQQERLFNLVANTSPALIWMAGPDGLCTYFNETWLKFTGRRLEQELGNGWRREIHPDDLASCLATYEAACDARRPFRMEYRLRRQDGAYRWILDEGLPRYGLDGAFEGYIGSCLDIHDHKQAAAEVAEARNLLRTVVDSIPDWIFAKDTQHRFLMVNRAFAAALDLAPDDMVGRSDVDFWPLSGSRGTLGSVTGRPREDDDEVLSGRSVHHPLDHATLADGSERIFDTLKLPLCDAGGRVFGVLAYARDVTVRRHAESALQQAVAQLRRSEQRQQDVLQLAQHEQGRMAALLAAMSIGILFEDASSRVVYLNPAFKRVWDIPDALDLVGCSTAQVLDHFTQRSVLEAHANEHLLNTTDPLVISQAIEINLADGRVLTQVSHPVKAPEGRDLGRLWLYEDVTQARQTAQQLIYLAERDPLTGLYNRHRFHEQLELMIAAARRSEGRFALLYFDLDEFKYVNDRFGHREGDAVLVRVAGEIGSQLRSTELFARLGGDEFAVLSNAGDPADIAVLAERIVGCVSSIPFRFRGNGLRMTSSLGVAIYPLHGETAEEMVAHADAAMYQAKDRGKNTWSLYDRALESTGVLVHRLSWSRRIAEALDRNLFELHFQGVYNTAGGRLGHLEALVRMRDPAAPQCLIMPGQFIAFAEKSGQILQIDRWVVRQAVELLARTPEIPAVAINVSGRSFDDPELPDYIRRQLARQNVPARRLMIELTETAAVSDMRDAQRFIDRIRQTGCSVCLDDFGSGFSSFAYLKYLDVDILKIDGLFISGLPQNPDNQVFVKAMVDVARGLNKSTVAEFVEDESTLRMIAELGVDMAQGYHLDRPSAAHPALAAP